MAAGGVIGGAAALPAVDPERLLATLRQLCAAEDLEFAELPHLLGAGGEARVDAFRLRGAPAHLSGPLVLRRLSELKDAQSVRWEGAVHAALVEGGFPAPRVLLVEPSAEPLGAPFLVAERVPGRMLLEEVTRPGDLATQPLRLPRLVFEALARVPRQLGETQAMLHDLDPGLLRRQLRATGFAPEAIGFAGRLEQIAAEADAASLGGLRSGFTWLHDRGAAAEREVICHGDFVFTNLCVANGRVAGVFDWSKVALAEPEYDVAASLARLQSTVPGVPRLLGLLFRTVQARLSRRYLACYRRRRPLDAERIRIYEAHWILHELVWSGRRLREGMRFDGAIEQRWLHPQAIDAGVERFSAISGVTLEPLRPR